MLKPYVVRKQRRIDTACISTRQLVAQLNRISQGTSTPPCRPPSFHRYETLHLSVKYNSTLFLYPNGVGYIEIRMERPRNLSLFLRFFFFSFSSASIRYRSCSTEQLVARLRTSSDGFYSNAPSSRCQLSLFSIRLPYIY